MNDGHNPFAGNTIANPNTPGMQVNNNTPAPPSVENKPFGTPDDPGFSVDLSEAETANVIPEGIYEAMVTSIEKGTSKSSGNPMWIWDFAIINGQMAGKDIRYWTALTPSALWKVAETLKAFDIDTSSRVEFKADDLIGRKCCINIVVENRDGRLRSNIKQVVRHPDGPKRGHIQTAPSVI